MRLLEKEENSKLILDFLFSFSIIGKSKEKFV